MISIHTSSIPFGKYQRIKDFFFPQTFMWGFPSILKHLVLNFVARAQENVSVGFLVRPDVNLNPSSEFLLSELISTLASFCFKTSIV